MYTEVKGLLKRLARAGEQTITFDVTDRRLAKAVLLLRVIMVDGKVRGAELSKYREILQDHFEVDPDELMLFESQVNAAMKDNHSLEVHTKIVAKMSLETKFEILKFMHEISVSDNELHEFEINLVDHVAHLMMMSDEQIKLALAQAK